MSVALPVTQSEDPRPADAQSITGPRDMRAVRTLRISITDRCNFRCIYCMPEERLDWVPRDALLTFEEIAAVGRVGATLGITAFKLTGGEPLVRHDLPRLVSLLKALPGKPELSLTTNGALLVRQARDLRAAGLDRITISLDTLDKETFKRITRGAELDQVCRGVQAALEAGFAHPKINCVAMKGVNDGEFADFAALTRQTKMTVRFIEYMPLGRTALGGEYRRRFIGEPDIRRAITKRLGPLSPAGDDAGHGPAKLWQLPGAAGKIGFISAMSRPFCETCNRLRLTAEGQLRSCLFDGGEIELRPILRRGRAGDDGALHESLRDAFIRCVAFKPDGHAYHGNRQMSQVGG